MDLLDSRNVNNRIKKTYSSHCGCSPSLFNHDYSGVWANPFNTVWHYYFESIAQ
jgi:hypothetical protein